MLDHVTLSLAVGGVAGTLGIIAMIAQKLPFRSCFAGFCLFFFAAVITFYSNLPYLPWWADGMGVAAMMALPVVLAFAGRERKAIPMILVNVVLLGFLISVAEQYL